MCHDFIKPLKVHLPSKFKAIKTIAICQPVVCMVYNPKLSIINDQIFYNKTNIELNTRHVNIYLQKKSFSGLNGSQII